MNIAEADEYNAIVDTYAFDLNDQILDVTASASGTTFAPMAPGHISHYLEETQKSQLRSNWCGPASAQSVILGWHEEKYWETTSAFDGQALSQAALSGWDYTRAGTSGSTDWVDGDMKRALNTWLFETDAFYVQYTPTSVAALEVHVTTDLDIDWMMASDMIERKNNASLHYNHHPIGLDIYHWTSIYGYATSGSTFALQDPAANTTVLGSAWDDVNPYFSMSSTKTYNLMKNNGIASRGIVW